MLLPYGIDVIESCLTCKIRALPSWWTGGKHRWRRANPSKLKHAFDGLTENIA